VSRCSTSHQPNGVDLIATMTSGSRTRVDGSGGAKSFSRFLGSYTYNPADFNTLTNVVVTDKGTIYPEQGTVRFTAKNRRTIVPISSCSPARLGGPLGWAI